MEDQGIVFEEHEVVEEKDKPFEDFQQELDEPYYSCYNGPALQSLDYHIGHQDKSNLPP